MFFNFPRFRIEGVVCVAEALVWIDDLVPNWVLSPATFCYVVRLDSRLTFRDMFAPIAGVHQ